MLAAPLPCPARRQCAGGLAPRAGGFIAAYKGSRCKEEVRQAEAYLWAHGANLVMVLGSPLAAKCNPLRQFAIVGKSG